MNALSPLAWWLGAAITAASATVVPTRFADAPGASAAWTAYGTAPEVEPLADGVRFRCPFTADTQRFYWDCIRPLDLSGPASLRFDLTADRPDAIRTLSIYFKSGPGWYHWSRPLNRAGRQTLSLTKASFAPEGRPAGWDQIERLRISPWRGTSGTVNLILHELVVRQDDILIVQGTSSQSQPGEREMSRRAAQRMSQWLDAAGIAHGSITDDAVAGGGLAHARAAILPYNTRPGVAELDALGRFLDRGGKLIVFGSASEPLARRMEVRLKPMMVAGRPGRWASMAFQDATQRRLPERVYNTAWSLQPAYPGSSRSRIIALWSDSFDRPGKLPACIATPHGYWFPALLRSDDPSGKQRMLTALLGDLAPEIWAGAAKHAFASIGRVAGSRDLADAIGTIRRAASADRRPMVEERLARVEAFHAQISRMFADQRYPETVDAAESARRLLVEAYGLVQPASPANELRGVWDHDAVGWYPGNWSRTCRELAEAGINAVFPNLLWSGKAHSASTVIPRSTTFATFGDQAAQSLAAAREAGLQLHAWKVCWKLENAPPSLIHRVRSEGRLQQSAQGSSRNWLCPSHPENVRYELEGIAEFLRAYHVDGLHLDYIRYPDADSCFCHTCRTAFTAHLGRPVAGWPRGVRSGPDADAWQNWRAERITSFVRRVRDTVQRISPDAALSAAVFRQYPSCRESVGQDWAQWVREGLVDFVCPMNYTPSTATFEAETVAQRSHAGAADRLAPGIGVSASESQLAADQVLDQIQVLRRLSTQGFLLFDLSTALREEVLPVLRLAAGP